MCSMEKIQNEILEYLGSEMNEDDVQQEFGGKTYDEILATLNEWFPTEENEGLAQAIADCFGE